jgi:hypothetical protein
MICPACHNATTNTSTCNGYHYEPSLCDNCLADLKAQDDEYGVYLANLPLYRKLQRKAAKTATSVKIAMHQWNAR